MMNNTLRIAVLGSTRGTDLQPLLKAQQTGTLQPAEIVVVVSDLADAYILERAKSFNIPTVVLPGKGKTRVDYGKELVAVLQDYNIDLVVLIGFMRILSAEVVQAFPQRIINIHPSLLPKYAGGKDLNVHEEVLKNGDTVTGCTLHYVTEDVDEGEIIMQQEVPVLPNDTVDSLKERVQQVEQQVLLQVIKDFAAQA